MDSEFTNPGTDLVSAGSVGFSINPRSINAECIPEMPIYQCMLTCNFGTGSAGHLSPDTQAFQHHHPRTATRQSICRGQTDYPCSNDCNIGAR